MAYSDPDQTSSYSDPIYDRLDTMSKAVRRLWWVYVLAFLIVLGGSILARTLLSERSDQASATAFSQAYDTRDPDSHTDSFKELAENPKADPYYRSRAWIELVQARINNGDADGAKTAAEQAVVEAKRSGDAELQANARLSLAAAEYQRNDFDGALADYGAVDATSSRFPMAQLEATLGEARCHEQLHQLPDAIAILEPLLTRTDAGAADLISLARVEYWNDRRLQEQATTGAKPGLAAPSASTTAAAVRASPAPTATTTNATPATVPAAAVQSPIVPAPSKPASTASAQAPQIPSVH